MKKSVEKGLIYLDKFIKASEPSTEYWHFCDSGKLDKSAISLGVACFEHQWRICLKEEFILTNQIDIRTIEDFSESQKLWVFQYLPVFICLIQIHYDPIELLV